MRYLDGAAPSRDLRAGILTSVSDGIHLVLDGPGDLGARLLDEAAAELGDGCKIVRVHAGPAGLSLSGLMAELAGIADLTAQDDAVLERVCRLLAVPDREGGRIALLLSGGDGLQRPALRFLQHMADSAKALVLVLAGGPRLVGALEATEWLTPEDRLNAFAAPAPGPIPLNPVPAVTAASVILAAAPPAEPHLPVDMPPVNTPPAAMRPASLPARRAEHPFLSRRGWISPRWALAGLGLAASVGTAAWVGRTYLTPVSPAHPVQVSWAPAPAAGPAAPVGDSAAVQTAAVDPAPHREVTPAPQTAAKPSPAPASAARPVHDGAARRTASLGPAAPHRDATPAPQTAAKPSPSPASPAAAPVHDNAGARTASLGPAAPHPETPPAPQTAAKPSPSPASPAAPAAHDSAPVRTASLAPAASHPEASPAPQTAAEPPPPASHPPALASATEPPTAAAATKAEPPPAPRSPAFTVPLQAAWVPAPEPASVPAGDRAFAAPAPVTARAASALLVKPAPAPVLSAAASEAEPEPTPAPAFSAGSAPSLAQGAVGSAEPEPAPRHSRAVESFAAPHRSPSRATLGIREARRTLRYAHRHFGGGEPGPAESAWAAPPQIGPYEPPPPRYIGTLTADPRGVRVFQLGE